MLTLKMVGGLVLLFGGGELLVRGSVLMALRLGVSPLIVGLVIVGFGSAAPQLSASLQAALLGHPGMAIGGIVGASIANILLILGLSALVYPLHCARRTALLDAGLMLGGAVALTGLAVGGQISRMDGIALLVGLALYLIALWQQEREAAIEGGALPPDEAAMIERSGMLARFNDPGLIGDIGLLLLGMVGIAIGGRLLVDGAVALAAATGLSETLIGLTVIAITTSLPELVTSVIAALNRQSEIAYGNVVGANVFNLLGIGGVTAIAQPIEVPQQIIAFDLPVLLAVSVAAAVLAVKSARLSRTSGAVLLIGYGFYLATLLR